MNGVGGYRRDTVKHAAEDDRDVPLGRACRRGEEGATCVAKLGANGHDPRGDVTRGGRIEGPVICSVAEIDNSSDGLKSSLPLARLFYLASISLFPEKYQEHHFLAEKKASRELVKIARQTSRCLSVY